MSDLTKKNELKKINFYFNNLVTNKYPLANPLILLNTWPTILYKVGVLANLVQCVCLHLIPFHQLLSYHTLITF